MKLIKVFVVEYQKEPAAIRAQTLDRVRNTGREEPQVTHAHVADKAIAFLIDGSNARLAVQHDRPFPFDVPMQLPDAAGCEPHFYAGNGCRNRQFTRRYLPRP